MLAAITLALIGVPNGFVPIKAGIYAVGKQGRLDNPLRRTRLSAFAIASTETTNSQFKVFVDETGYKTDAERFKNAMVFRPPQKEFRWVNDPTANWRFPNGIAAGGIEGRMDHPVTSISFHDALEYCIWAKVRLPTLDEWEVASRSGARSDWFFGHTPAAIGRYANIWHGQNHLQWDVSDGYRTTAPVAKFKPSPNGLYDIYGNVFEFCTGHLKSDSSERIVHSRGGSWWCSRKSCNFFNSVDIGSVDIRASFSNQGFRVVKL